MLYHDGNIITEMDDSLSIDGKVYVFRVKYSYTKIGIQMMLYLVLHMKEMVDYHTISSKNCVKSLTRKRFYVK